MGTVTVSEYLSHGHCYAMPRGGGARATGQGQQGGKRLLDDAGAPEGEVHPDEVARAQNIIRNRQRLEALGLAQVILGPQRHFRRASRREVDVPQLYSLCFPLTPIKRPA